ncbi:DUF5312 family protein [Treponema zioleckii]|uniref:DUF5312 family protein n=1 Tax=Treponema zioleckii TaxID=331680 RepID=UPI00168BAA4D|nr:DUF5312 family protein [Treponema zioleckii]
MTTTNSFDRMVSGLSVDERQAILEKMKEAAPTFEGEVLEPVEDDIDDEPIPLSEQLKHEPLFTRILLWVKSVFTKSTMEVLYNEVKINEISKKVERNYPGLIDSKRGYLLSSFRSKLMELKEVADFFRPYVLAFEQDEGNFLVFLGNMVMPTVSSEMDTEVDPYSGDVSEGVKPEFRMTLLHHMDDIFANITREDKARMYDAVKSVEWLRYFVKLPFNRLIVLFASVTDDIFTCIYSQVESEISQVANCLSISVKFTDELLKAFYLFSIKTSLKKRSIQDEPDDEAVEYINNARSKIAVLHMFMSSVPMRSIGCIVSEDCHWRPTLLPGGEDWFVKFKTCWKKIFEQKWESWCQECKREALRQSLKENFELDEFPLFPDRPWRSLWGGIYFRYELTGGFLFWFFREKFPTFEIALKTVLVEGNFIKKENQNMYTDAFNDYVQASISMTQIGARLAPSGDVGAVILKLNDEHLRTLQAQTKVEQQLRTVEADIQTVLHKFGEATRMMDNLLCGILGLKKDTRFDSLSNLSRLQGKDNEKFLGQLYDARRALENALNLIKELETVDSPLLMVAD